MKRAACIILTVCFLSAVSNVKVFAADNRVKADVNYEQLYYLFDILQKLNTPEVKKQLSLVLSLMPEGQKDGVNEVLSILLSDADIEKKIEVMQSLPCQLLEVLRAVFLVGEMLIYSVGLIEAGSSGFPNGYIFKLSIEYYEYMTVCSLAAGLCWFFEFRRGCFNEYGKM